MKLRLIQSNDRGLITKVGDRTFSRRRPAKGEEFLEFPTLFIWVKKPQRYLSRCWTSWTGETIGSDFIYEVTRFRDVVDLEGQNRFHQWCSQQLRQEMWELTAPIVDTKELVCPPPEIVYEANRHKTALFLQHRKLRIKEQTPVLTQDEKDQIKAIYAQRDSLNQEARCIEYHVDHIQPLSKGGLHHPDNLRVVGALENMSKGARTDLLCQ